jgi:ATP-binding cassette, subfamily A (ABC1), member 3
MALFPRQIWTLTVKNLLVALVRHWFSTPVRAFLLPCIFIGFLSYARFLFIPPSVYGIGTPSPVRSLPDALDLVSGGRNKLVFVNSGYTGGDIDRVINSVAAPLRDSGKQIVTLDQEEELLSLCRNTLRGTSSCIAAAVFFSSPTEGPGGRWNYSIRADGGLESKIVTDSTKNDVQIYALPLQHSVDFAIARLNSTVDQASLPKEVLQYSYTSETKKQRDDNIRVRYMGGIIDILAVAFFIGMVGVTYQLTGLIASERENGMAQLLDCMMPNTKRWQPQAARIIANHIAFDIMYGPAWIVMAIILSVGVFSRTSAAIMVIFHILAGLSMSSLSIFGAAFFHKAQLSGITSTIVCMLLAVIAQVASKAGTASVAILSLLFPPMNYVYFIILMARFERQSFGTSLIKTAPYVNSTTSSLPGIVLWIFLIIQIIIFPILGAWVERTLYGTASKSRTVDHSQTTSKAVSLTGFSKHYRQRGISRFFSSAIRRRGQDVVAVNDLTLTAEKGQIMVLLGANGSGKSTTLDAIAGLTSITTGSIQVHYPEGEGGFGLCPQKNVLWADLTVREHVKIFNSIKSATKNKDKAYVPALLANCDIHRKMDAYSKTLSGGQKRKLQLAMMFTGGSSVCCVDEVSSGLDPISRRKIWDILLAERGRRSIILTTHFLDEADLLSDHIAILSKGSLRAGGTAVELKHKLGSGYRVHVYRQGTGQHVPRYEDVPGNDLFDQTVYTLSDSAAAAAFVARLEKDGIKEYQVNGPTIEDVFLKVAEEIKLDEDESDRSPSPVSLSGKEADAKVVAAVTSSRKAADTPQLVTGKRISIPKQAWVLFRKRFVVLRRNYLPYASALLIPIIAAGLVTLFLKNFEKAGCSPQSSISVSDIDSLASQVSYHLVVGPSSKLPRAALEQFAQSLPGGGESGSTNLTGFIKSLHMVDTLDEFNNYIDTRFANVTPGGVFLGEGSSPATFAWQGNADISFATIIQNAIDTFLTGIPISNQYQAFDQPWGASVGSALQLITYFGLAMSVYPAFFALYPTIERLRNVRALHYSNGVRAFPLWLAYMTFDFMIVLLASAVAVIIFAASSSVWYHEEYLFLIFFLYGLAATLTSYVVSLFARSQLSAFAFAVLIEVITFLGYFIAYMSILTYAPITQIDHYVNVAHFTIAAISPIANVQRALFVTLNVFSITCRDRAFASDPGSITVYGGPILYLILQSFLLFSILLWWDSGPLFRRFKRTKPVDDVEEKHTSDAEISDELTRVTSSQDGLRVLNVSKRFKDNLAVDDVTFGVPRGEVFALLGPNGAGKSTTISLIRGDIQPSRRGGQILVENVSVSKHRAQARSHLGVCAQFDAMDVMTVIEHLDFYARIRGVPDPAHNVKEVIRAVGLQDYTNRMAQKLSGGNKRKLSLGIALMGNPSVLLLDEPSSGMDAASKRVMWRTLASVVPGRSLVLTTHSMEEADALADRAGIMAGRMLALGTTDYLRRKHGNAYYVHLVSKDAPYTSDAEMARVRAWILEHFPHAVVESKTYHGQMRFSVPVGERYVDEKGEELDRISSVGGSGGISALFSRLEMEKGGLNIEYYSVSQTTLDQVFLSIVGKHEVEEEGEREEREAAIRAGGRERWWKMKRGMRE